MPDHRGPKVGRLSDLVQDGKYITVTCERRECQHTGRLEPGVLMARLGDVSVEAVNQAAVCSHCGGRQFHMQMLLRVVPGTPEYEPHNR